MREATRALPDLKRVKIFRATRERLYSGASQPLWPDHSITAYDPEYAYGTYRHSNNTYFKECNWRFNCIPKSVTEVAHIYIYVYIYVYAS